MERFLFIVQIIAGIVIFIVLGFHGYFFIKYGRNWYQYGKAQEELESIKFAVKNFFLRLWRR